MSCEKKLWENIRSRRLDHLRSIKKHIIILEDQLSGVCIESNKLCEDVKDIDQDLKENFFRRCIIYNKETDEMIASFKKSQEEHDRDNSSDIQNQRTGNDYIAPSTDKSTKGDDYFEVKRKLLQCIYNMEFPKDEKEALLSLAMSDNRDLFVLFQALGLDNSDLSDFKEQARRLLKRLEKCNSGAADGKRQRTEDVEGW